MAVTQRGQVILHYSDDRRFISKKQQVELNLQQSLDRAVLSSFQAAVGRRFSTGGRGASSTCFTNAASKPL